MRFIVSLGVVAALHAQIAVGKEAVGTWDDSDTSNLEAYYEDEDFFAHKAGKVPFTPPPKDPSPKTFFLESSVALKSKVPDTWNEAQYSSSEHVENIRENPSAEFSPIHKLRRSARQASNILAPPAAMRFEEVVEDKSKAQAESKSEATAQVQAKAVSESAPPLPIDGIITTRVMTNMPTAYTGSLPPDCNSFANSAGGSQLYQYFVQQYPQFYAAHPCNGFELPAGTDPLAMQNFPTINGANTLHPNLLAEAPGAPKDVATVAGNGHPYYSEPIKNMIPALQIPQMKSPPINFYSDGTRYPKNMEHYDAFPKAAAAAGATPAA